MPSETEKPIHDLVRNNDIAAVKTYLNGDGDPNLVSEKDMTLLHVAAANGHLAIVRLLMEKGASVNLKDKNGDTPLNHAAGQGHTDVVKFLLENGAKVDLGGVTYAQSLRGIKVTAIRTLKEDAGIQDNAIKELARAKLAKVMPNLKLDSAPFYGDVHFQSFAALDRQTSTSSCTEALDDFLSKVANQYHFLNMIKEPAKQRGIGKLNEALANVLVLAKKLELAGELPINENEKLEAHQHRIKAVQLQAIKEYQQAILRLSPGQKVVVALFALLGAVIGAVAGVAAGFGLGGLAGAGVGAVVGAAAGAALAGVLSYHGLFRCTVLEVARQKDGRLADALANAIHSPDSAVLAT